MKIIIVTHAYPRHKEDWSANFIEELCKAYQRAGCEITLFIPNTKGWERNKANMDGIRFIQYNYFSIRKWQVFGYGNALKNDQEFSLWQILLTPFLVFSATKKLSKILKKDSSYNFIHAHWALPNGIIAIWARKMSRIKIPIFTSFPGSDITALSNIGRLGKLITKKILQKSDYLSCNSSDLKEKLIELGLQENKIDLVIYGVNSNKILFNKPGRIRIRSLLGIKDNEKVLLMVGRFVAKKGFSTGIKAMKKIVSQLPLTKMVLVGDGILKSEYLKIIQNDGTGDHIIFTGSIPADQLIDYYSACDIFIMPSSKLPADGLNVALVEAMSCSRPVVATNSGGNDIVVQNGKNGFLIDENNYLGLADMVIRLLNDQDLMERMGNASRKLVENKFDWDAIVQHYLNKYFSLLH